MTYIENEDGTSLLRVVLDDFSSKCLHSLCNCPEDWVENIISSRCYRQVKDRHCGPPVGKCIENENGSCIIEVEIDVVHTECMKEIFSNIPEQINSILSERINDEADEIVERVMDPNKSRYQIVMEHQNTTPVQVNEDFVDPMTIELQKTRADLEKTRLDGTRAVTDIKTRLDDTRAELTETRNDLQTTRADLQTTKADLATLQAVNQKLEARIALLETTLASLIS